MVRLDLFLLLYWLVASSLKVWCIFDSNICFWFEIPKWFESFDLYIWVFLLFLIFMIKDFLLLPQNFQFSSRKFAFLIKFLIFNSNNVVASKFSIFDSKNTFWFEIFNFWLGFLFLGQNFQFLTGILFCLKTSNFWLRVLFLFRNF